MTSVDVVTTGQGPGLVLLPGGTRRARHYQELAAALSDSYTVHVIERRGRGRSPAQGDDYSVAVEVADTMAVLAETGSRQLFGHSYGGLIALHTALVADLDRVIAFEPSISVNGSLPAAWLPRYEELLAQGHDARAMVHYLHSLDFMPGGPVVTAAVWAMHHLTAEGRAVREVLPVAAGEARAARDTDSDGSRYTAIGAPVLLLGGGRSPAYLQEVLPLLVELIPQAELIMTPEFDHNAPDLGDPKGVAELIRA